jgi:hypothetical protein
MFSLRKWLGGGFRNLLADRSPLTVSQPGRQRGRRPRLEELESRLAPTVNFPDITPGAIWVQCDDLEPNTVTVYRQGGMTVISGTGTFPHSFPSSQFTGIYILGGALGTVTNIQANVLPVYVYGAAHDTVNVGNTADGVQDIQADLRMWNRSSYNTININDSADPLLRAVTHDTVMGGHDYVPYGRITGLAPATISYRCPDTSSVTIDTGVGGATVNVLSTGTNHLAGGLPLTLVGHAPGTVNVGNPAHGVQDIQGELRIQDPPSYDRITIDDTADLVARTVTQDTWAPPPQFDPYGRITGLAPATISYKYADTSSLTVNTGYGGATVNVLSTGRNGLSTGLPLTLVGHALGSVNVGNPVSGVQSIQSDLLIENPPSFDAINIDDTADPFYQFVTHDTWNPPSDPVPYGRIFGLAPGTISYEYDDTTSVNVATGVGGATVNVLSTGVPLALLGNGPTVVNVHDANGVQDIRGALTIQNPTGATTLNINDCGDPGNRTLTESLASGFGTISGLAPAAISFRVTDLEGLNVLTDSGVTTILGSAVNYFFGLGFPVSYSACGGGIITYQ